MHDHTKQELNIVLLFKFDTVAISTSNLMGAFQNIEKKIQKNSNGLRENRFFFKYFIDVLNTNVISNRAQPIVNF